MDYRKLLIFLPIGLFSCVLFFSRVQAQELELYVDPVTKQIFTEAGSGRVRMGRVKVVSDEPLSPDVTKPSPRSEATTSQSSENENIVTVARPGPLTEQKTTPWYEKLSLRGYTQLRYHQLIDKDGAKWFHPADKSVAEDRTFLIRRGRLILSGDVSDYVAIYIQPDLIASPVSDADNALQLRDAYADIAIDSNREYRFRIGQSKVPFGFVNLQSSQNRIPLERPEALNSAAEGERDIGVYFYWAPEEIRKRFRMLNREGLKGSGDYGVFGLGAYSGQGLNRSDQNDSLHTIVRVSYPFLLDNGQIIEPGLQAYTGSYVPRTGAIPLAEDTSVTPTFAGGGVQDHRVGASFIIYPQPIGLEAEWNFGEGPALRADYSAITSEYLHGGYVQLNAKISSPYGLFYPFTRWQYYDGGRKFGRNAPNVELNEWDFGVEWSPWKAFELAAVTTYTKQRTNTNSAPYEQLTDGIRFGLQAQFNY